MAEVKRKKGRRIWMSIVTLLFFSFVLFMILDQTRYKSSPPTVHVLLNNNVSREALLGTYEWESGDQRIKADSDHPAYFTYEEEHRLEASKGQKVYMSISKEQGEMPIEVIHFEVYAKGSSEKLHDAKYSINGDTLVLHVEEESGEYVYVLFLDYGDRGSAVYGININVDQRSFPVDELKKLSTPYVGNSVKVGEILSKLPMPGSGYVQRYLALKTVTEPYGVIVYYEPVEELSGHLIFPVENPINNVYENMEINAMVLFSLIDNVDTVTFKVRQTPSKGELEDGNYDGKAIFTRDELVKKYGELENILDDKELFN